MRRRLLKRQLVSLGASTWVLTHLVDIAEAAVAVEGTVETPGPAAYRARRVPGKLASFAAWGFDKAPEAEETAAKVGQHAEVAVATQVGGPLEAALVAVLAVLGGVALLVVLADLA